MEGMLDLNGLGIGDWAVDRARSGWIKLLGKRFVVMIPPPIPVLLWQLLVAQGAQYRGGAVGCGGQGHGWVMPIRRVIQQFLGPE